MAAPTGAIGQWDRPSHYGNRAIRTEAPRLPHLNTREFAAFIAPGSSRNFACAAGSLLTTPRRRGRSS